MKLRFSLSSLAIAVGAIALAAPAPRLAAQQATTGFGWAAFTGCWSPVRAPDGAEVSTLCVVPAGTASAVDLTTVASGQVISRERVDATGLAVNGTLDGCKGWSRAEWSRDGQRVYLHGEYTCQGGQRQVSSSLLGLTSGGQLMNVQGLVAGTNKGVRVAEYRRVAVPDSLPSDMRAALGTRTMAMDAAGVAASAPITTKAVIEASTRLDPLVVEAWLANHGGVLPVDARDLVAMADAGVPGDVTDVLVALSHPDQLALSPELTGDMPDNAGAYASRGVATARPDDDADRPRRTSCAYSVYWMGGNTCYYSSWYGYGMTGPYWGYDSYYGYGSYLGAGAYYGPYSPYGYGWGGGWYSGGPVVVVNPPSTGGNAYHGRVVKGRGYVSGRPSGSQAQGGSSARAGSASPSGTQAAPPAKPASPPRTAHPRGSGGGGGGGGY
ncbi:MAG TPA: hypothetical protein VFK16_08140 [Gemmatimonadaceae bacterium]|nr:hypothetical protein [Gemmatimonadaceae bacterium]